MILLAILFGKIPEHVHAMVVFILPTFVSSDILANSTANIGVSTILSFKTLEHLLDLYNAFTYRSQKCNFAGVSPGIFLMGLVKTVLASLKM
jgi:hypothetical protein